MIPESKPILTDGARYRLLKLLDSNPCISQRELAEALEISLGKANYCIHALVEKGWIKIVNIQNNARRTRYFYKLTPKGMSEKTRSTRRFLIHKIEEYKRLESEIEVLKQEVVGVEHAKLVCSD